MSIREVTVYETEDGRRHLSRAAAEAHLRRVSLREEVAAFIRAGDFPFESHTLRDEIVDYIADNFEALMARVKPFVVFI